MEPTMNSFKSAEILSKKHRESHLNCTFFIFSLNSSLQTFEMNVTSMVSDFISKRQL